MKNKFLKPILVILAVILMLTAAALIVMQQGLLRRISAQAMAEMSEVPQYDVLTWQSQREIEILADYQGGSYTLQSPYIIQDPYHMNPLSALVIFETPEKASITLTVEGNDAYTTFKFTQDTYTTHHELSVLGLYAGRETQVELTALYADGRTESSRFSISTEALPVDFQAVEVKTSHPEKMEPGATLMIACFQTTYTYLLDAAGEVRGYLSNKYMAHGTSILLLRNGHLLATGDELKQMPYNMTSLWELNWLGKIYTEYEIPNAVHHGIFELANGDILAVSNNLDMFKTGTREDVAVIIDRQSGLVKKSYDFRQILDERRNPYTHFHPDIKNAVNIDWMHMNAAIYDDHDDSLIVSSPIQSVVLKIDAQTQAIKWMLSSPEGWRGEFARYQPYLLTPTGSNFAWPWGQHDPMLLPDMDNDPQTLDLLLFDNGQSKSFDQAGAVPPESNTSRAVLYRIDEDKKTITQLWEYGTKRGSEVYSTFLGDADYLPLTKNRLIDFGGMLRRDDKPVDDIVAGVLGNVTVNSRVVEVTETGDVVFEVYSHTNSNAPSAETYQAERIPLYSPAYTDLLTQTPPKRLGEIQAIPVSDEYKLPPFFINTLQVHFDHLIRENNNLLASGYFTYLGQSYTLGKALIILQNDSHTYIFPANSGLNSQFYLRTDLSGLEPGEYAVTLLGAVVEGNDALSGNQKPGYIQTGYKVTITP